MLIVIVIENRFLNTLFGIGLLIFIYYLLNIFYCKNCYFVEVTGNLVATFEPISFTHRLLTLLSRTCMHNSPISFYVSRFVSNTLFCVRS